MTAKKTAAPAPDAAPVKETQPKPAIRTALLARLAELKYTGPTSLTAAVLRDDVLPWLQVGAPEGDESVPNGVRFAVHPHLRPAPKSGASTEARVLVRNLRKAVSAILTDADPTEALNEVDGLSAQLRGLLSPSAS